MISFPGLVMAALAIVAFSIEGSLPFNPGMIYRVARERKAVYCPDTIPRKNKNKENIKRMQPEKPRPKRDSKHKQSVAMDGAEMISYLPRH